MAPTPEPRRAFYSQGKYAEAESLYQRALDIFEGAFGPNHPHTIRVSKNYAVLLRRMDREDDAARLERQLSTLPQND